jgi:hypothetical protein
LFPTAAARRENRLLRRLPWEFLLPLKTFKPTPDTPKPGPRRYTPSEEAETLVSLLTEAVELTKTLA